MEAPEDVDGVLELCHVLVKDQTDSSRDGGVNGQHSLPPLPRGGAGGRGPYVIEREDLAEEQGWVARMVHLFRSDNLDVQFEVSCSSPFFYSGSNPCC